LKHIEIEAEGQIDDIKQKEKKKKDNKEPRRERNE
jgi:hypothetical protein